ncbi:F-box protein At5g03970-like [Diospyros lotus]|uniref:F-box protein At5g03970-like n=1 Tax=Diospyros lotus TaxID=55363 RepID=UPI002255C3EB|nr:F-box protein At5g03970-like [Diospyros lotus]
MEVSLGNNDISIEILSRLPTKSLVGLKCVSKELNSLVLERSFAKRQLKKGEPVCGFFFQERYQWCDDDIKSISYIPVKVKGTELQRSVFNFLPECVVLLAVCNGLICCRSCFSSPQPVIYVCNPLNREWVILQWPEPDKKSSLGLAFDPVNDPIDKSTNFKVVRAYQTVNEAEDSYFSFDLYSSKTGTWSRSVEMCQCHHKVIKNKGIFVEGALFWLTDGDKVLMFDIEKQLSWLVTVPTPLVQFDSIPEMCIGESKGKLHYVLISDDGLHVWALEDSFDFIWALEYSVALDEMERENSNLLCNIRKRVAARVYHDMDPWIDPLAFKDGLLLMKVASKIYLYNVETRKLDQLCTVSMLGPNATFSPIVLPYTMSLVPLGRP